MIEYSNKRVNGFYSDYSQILIILLEILSWPRALFMFNALIILRILSLFESKEHSHDWVKKIWLFGSMQSFFRGVLWSAKNVLKIFAFVWISMTNL